MTAKVITHSGAREFENVKVMASGWVKCYDDVNHEGGETTYNRLRHYPPSRVKAIHGKASYQSPHGRV